ncbi:unnamed protein product, partial [marine sediment metagenome]
EKLRKGIIKNYDKISGDIIAKHREIENDKKFISENYILIKLISLITDFALKDRYFELNYAIKEQRNGKTNGDIDVFWIITYFNLVLISLNLKCISLFQIKSIKVFYYSPVI